MFPYPYNLLPVLVYTVGDASPCFPSNNSLLLIQFLYLLPPRRPKGVKAQGVGDGFLFFFCHAGRPTFQLRSAVMLSSCCHDGDECVVSTWVPNQRISLVDHRKSIEEQTYECCYESGCCVHLKFCYLFHNPIFLSFVLNCRGAPLFQQLIILKNYVAWPFRRVSLFLTLQRYVDFGNRQWICKKKWGQICVLLILVKCCLR